MLYDYGISYNEPYFRYSGVRVVEPSTFGPTANITDIKIYKVVLLHPESITSKLVFVPLSNIVIGTGQEQVTESTASMSFETFSSGYIVFNVEEEEAYAVSSAETILLEDNSAGTTDVTIIPTA